MNAISEVMYCLNGDLNQMGVMAARLNADGFDVRMLNVYPGFASLEEYKKALRYLWVKRIEGWWGQERDLIKYGICTQTEYDDALGRKGEQRKD